MMSLKTAVKENTRKFRNVSPRMGRRNNHEVVIEETRRRTELLDNGRQVKTVATKGFVGDGKTTSKV